MTVKAGVLPMQCHSSDTYVRSFARDCYACISSRMVYDLDVSRPDRKDRSMERARRLQVSRISSLGAVPLEHLQALTGTFSFALHQLRESSFASSPVTH